MGIIEHNLEKEKRLIELLGYSLLGPDGSNRWIILDENQNQVGHIQYKKMYNGNSKKGYSKIFGYHTVINSSNIIYTSKRNNNDKEGNVITNTDFDYSFDIKRDNQEIDHVEINTGDIPSLYIWSKKYGFLEFKIDDKGLYLAFKRKTEQLNIEELLIYRNTNEYYDKKKYVYQETSCDKVMDLSEHTNKGKTIKEISGTKRYCEDQLEVSEKIWVDGEEIAAHEYSTNDTVEEMAIKDGNGIDCFNRFRLLINQLIPFNEDVISAIVSDENIRQYNLSIFFPDYEKKISKPEMQKKLIPSKKN